MAWGQDQSTRLVGELLGMLIQGKPAAWENRNTPQKKEANKPKRGNFGDGWHCGSCGFYNFGERTKCFKRKFKQNPLRVRPEGKEEEKLRGKGSGKSGASKPPTQTPVGPRPEQVLTKQLSQTTDAPVKQALQDALDKVKQAKFQSLSLRDQRASLLNRAKQLADKVDRHYEIIDKALKAVAKRDSARDELFEVQEKIRALPTEPVPERANSASQ
eukprot:2736809-Amphidinium_carterae.1